jgi:hypothetical protein
VFLRRRGHRAQCQQRRNGHTIKRTITPLPLQEWITLSQHGLEDRGSSHLSSLCSACLAGSFGEPPVRGTAQLVFNRGRNRARRGATAPSPTCLASQRLAEPPVRFQEPPGFLIGPRASIPRETSAPRRKHSAEELEAVKRPHRLAGVQKGLLRLYLGADSGGSRPRIRDDVAQHSDLISLGVPR